MYLFVSYLQITLQFIRMMQSVSYDGQVNRCAWPLFKISLLASLLHAVSHGNDAAEHVVSSSYNTAQW